MAQTPADLQPLLPSGRQNSLSYDSAGNTTPPYSAKTAVPPNGDFGAGEDPDDMLWGPVHLVNDAITPKDVSPKFLRLHGSIEYNWKVVTGVSVAPFGTHIGLSNATLYHCILTLKREECTDSFNSSGSSSGSTGALGSLHGPIQPVMGPSGRRLSNNLAATPAQSSGLYAIASTSDDGHGSGASDDRAALLNSELTSPTARSKSAAKAKHQPGAFSRLFSRLKRSSFMEDMAFRHLSTGPLEGALSPPTVLVLKHYNTADVESQSMALRWFRHVTHNTLDDMYRHEFIYYIVVRPLLTLYKDKFRSPQCFFAARLDRGQPGFCRYVCCRHGSGSVATIGIEDVTRDGYAFSHAQRQGIADVGATLACVYSIAHLHSAMWGRPATDPALSGIENASILLGVHRVAASFNGRTDLNKMQLRQLILEWQSYAPLLRLDAVVRAIAETQRTWQDIRGRAVDLVKSKTTLLHGDFHFKNIGIRKKLGGRPPGWDPKLPFSDADIAAVDFQNFGYGCGTAELLYFMCTSLPVEILSAPRYTHATVLLLDGFDDDPVNTMGSFGANPIPRDSFVSGEDSVGNSARGKGGSGDETTSGSSGVHSRSIPLQVPAIVTPSASSNKPMFPPSPQMLPVNPSIMGNDRRSRGNDGPTAGVSPTDTWSATEDDHQPSFPRMRVNEDFATFATLEELRQYDEALLRCYYNCLSADARASLGSFSKLRADFYLLARHWAGTILMDMCYSTVEERQAQKLKPELSRLVEWGEKTSARVLLTIAALHASESAAAPVPGLEPPNASNRHGSLGSSFAGSEALRRITGWGSRARKGSISPAQARSLEVEPAPRSRTL